MSCFSTVESPSAALRDSAILRVAESPRAIGFARAAVGGGPLDPGIGGGALDPGIGGSPLDPGIGGGPLDPGIGGGGARGTTRGALTAASSGEDSVRVPGNV